MNRRVSDIIRAKWKTRNGYKVPTVDTIALSGGGVRCNGVVLYADLAQSSFLASDFQQRTAAKVIKSFLRCCSLIITKNNGKVTSFDGDRVMGVYVGKNRENRAVLSGLQINAAVTDILRPRLYDHFQSMNETPYEVDHCVGIDISDFLAVRAGHAGSNDLIWIGRAPNLAAKLSDIRHSEFKTIITADVYKNIETNLIYDYLVSLEPLWIKSSFQFLNREMEVYATSMLRYP